MKHSVSSTSKLKITFPEKKDLKVYWKKYITEYSLPKVFVKITFKNSVQYLKWQKNKQ